MTEVMQEPITEASAWVGAEIQHREDLYYRLPTSWIPKGKATEVLVLSPRADEALYFARHDGSVAIPSGGGRVCLASFDPTQRGLVWIPTPTLGVGDEPQLGWQELFADLYPERNDESLAPIRSHATSEPTGLSRLLRRSHHGNRAGDRSATSCEQRRASSPALSGGPASSHH